MGENYSKSMLDLLYTSKSYKELRKICENPAVPSEWRSYAAGLLCRPWLPWGKVRKVIFVLITAISVLAALVFEAPYFLFLLLIAASFSPRFVAEVSYLLGKLFRKAA